MNALAAALVKAQAAMPKVEKDGRNPHFRSEFVTLDHLLDKVRPVLNEHGLAVVQLPAALADGTPALTTTLIHGESGEQLSSTMPLVLGKQDMQGVGAAITYARRYMLAAALGIAEGEDDDGNTAAARPLSATRSEGEPRATVVSGDTGPVGETPASPSDDSKSQFQPPAGTIERTISTGKGSQQERLWTIFRQTGMPETVMRDIVKRVAGVESTGEIPWSKYDAVIAEIQKEHEVPF